MLLENGNQERTVDHWCHMAELGVSLLPANCTIPFGHPADFCLLSEKELQNCDVVSLWTVFRYAWSRKLLADGTPAPNVPVQGLPYRPIPPHLGGQTPPYDPDGPYGKYPLAHYYPNAESALQWIEWRALERAQLGHEPWPHPVPWQ